MPSEHSLKADYFEGMFRNDPDPWALSSSPYEAAKHAATVEALGGRRYRRGLEVGCAGGALTRRLAPACDHLTALDISETAAARARDRTADLTQVEVRRMTFPAETPSGLFDLIVLSEVAYYWSDADLERAAAWLRTAVEPDGDLLLVHWTGETDYPQSGDAAVAKLWTALSADFLRLREETTTAYRLDLWRRR